MAQESALVTSYGRPPGSLPPGAIHYEHSKYKALSMFGIIGCIEGVLQIVDGKAKRISEKYCDGLGICLGECPQGAITIEERDT